MKYILFLFLGLAFTHFSIAQNPISVKVSGNVFNTTVDSVYLSQFIGNSFVNISSAPMSKKGDFAIKCNVPYQDFYVLRFGDERINLILREGSDVKVYGDGKNLTLFCNIIGSEESANMKEFIGQMQQINMRSEELQRAMQANPAEREQIARQLENELNAFKTQRQVFVSQNNNSPALLPALSTIDPNTEWAEFEQVAMMLQNSLPGSPTIKGNFDNFLAQKAQKEALDFLAPGKPAPDFEELMVDGKTKMKLSDLKGKVVLLDFWASWCGPCRRENPNVVALYEKYKNKGFTVMSVSLDKEGDKWKQAITQDKLAWPYHVSDLQGWSCAAAKVYQVRGIPFTVLIDQEGNIIQTKLRGPDLERELQRIFGE